MLYYLKKIQISIHNLYKLVKADFNESEHWTKHNNLENYNKIWYTYYNYMVYRCNSAKRLNLIIPNAGK